MSLILEEFEKENIEEAIYKFKEQIFDYDVIANHNKVIETYKTPTNYIAPETRDLPYKKVSESTLDYLITKCRKCPLKHRVEATKALLCKYYLKIRDRYSEDIVKDKILNMKEKIIESMEQTSDDLSLSEDYDFGTLPKSIYSSILYLIQIKIGGNYLKKIGITDRDTMKPRISEIKSSYRSNTKKQFNISIKPIYIYSMDNAKEVEQEFIKNIVSNGGKFDTKYIFDGSTECLTGKYSKLANTVFSEIIEKFSKESYQLMFK